MPFQVAMARIAPAASMIDTGAPSTLPADAEIAFADDTLSSMPTLSDGGSAMVGTRNAEASTRPPEAPHQLTQELTQDWIDQRVFDLYDEYCHGQIDRREFLARSAAVTIGGLVMAQALLPRYVQAQTISFTDTRIKARYVTYPSPGGTSGTMRGYLVQPNGPVAPHPHLVIVS
jgi:hypothetical protein